MCNKEWRDYKPLTWRIDHGVFITHESYHFVEKRGWNVILPFKYFDLYFTKNNTYLININHWVTGVESWKNS